MNTQNTNKKDIHCVLSGDTNICQISRNSVQCYFKECKSRGKDRQQWGCEDAPTLGCGFLGPGPLGLLSTCAQLYAPSTGAQGLGTRKWIQSLTWLVPGRSSPASCGCSGGCSPAGGGRDPPRAGAPAPRSTAFPAERRCDALLRQWKEGPDAGPAAEGSQAPRLRLRLQTERKLPIVVLCCSHPRTRIPG